MNATVTCEKCGKPLGMFDGNICNECANNAVLEQIQADIYEEFMTIDGGVHDVSALKCMEIIDKYKGDKE